MKETFIRLLSKILPAHVNSWMGRILRSYTYKKRTDEYWVYKYGKHFPWKNPKTLNEKILWMELCSDTSLWTRLTDKIQVRKFVEEKGFADYLPGLIRTYKDETEIDFAELPNRCVLKCNHDSGSAVIIDKAKGLDEDEIRSFLHKRMQMRNFGDILCETHYNKIKPCIFAEEFIEPTNEAGLEEAQLIDYKFHCFDGQVDICVVCYDRVHGEGRHATFDIYDSQPWRPRRDLIPEEYLRNLSLRDIPEPANLPQMLNIAKTLSKGINHVRVDLYTSGDKVYFGEMTFTPTAARITYLTEEKLLEMGERITIP